MNSSSSNSSRDMAAATVPALGKVQQVLLQAVSPVSLLSSV
jgi:hypothetical protein